MILRDRMTPGFWELVGFWVTKVVLFTLICFFLGWLGLRAIDALTPRIHQRGDREGPDRYRALHRWILPLPRARHPRRRDLAPGRTARR